MDIVKQKYKRDCAVCCVAMATGLDYETVATAAGHRFDPFFGTWDIYDILGALNIEAKCVPELPKGKALVSYMTGVVDKGTALTHMLYFDGENFHDPANVPDPYMKANPIYRIIAL